MIQGDLGCFMCSRVIQDVLCCPGWSRVFHVFQGDPGCSRMIQGDSVCFMCFRVIQGCTRVLQGGPEWFQVFQAVLRDSWVFQRLSNVFQDVSECSRVIQGVPG